MFCNAASAFASLGKQPFAALQKFCKMGSLPTFAASAQTVQKQPFLERLLTAAIYPSAEKNTRSSTLTFEQTKCCALHEWLQWRAALQHFELVANGS
jgi:hypothetical protein